MTVVKFVVTRGSSPRYWGGAGFIVQFLQRTCLIMTNQHVIHKVKTIDVVLPPDGRELTGGRVQAEDKDADLAIVRFDNVDGDFQPMVFAEFASLSSFVEPVYLLAYFNGIDCLPSRSPGRIDGMFVEKHVYFFHGSFASQAGTSGGPVTKSGKVVAVNCGAGGGGGSRRAISLLAVYNTLMRWCDLENGNYTIAEMLRRLV
ncbi:unnamed protein product [Alopecurus aequalis]